MPECNYCRKIFPGVGLGGDDHNWLTCANSRIEALETALRHIIGMAGNPSAAEGCRLIINRAKEALGET